VKKGGVMKKDCASVRQSLHKYLRGHMFKYEQVRIARHLNACPFCRSEFQAIKKMADTKQLLKDITPPESVSQRMKAGAAGLAGLKVLIYRPLWVVLLLGVATILYVNLFAPQRDVEIENIEKTLPAAMPVASGPSGTAPEAAASPVTASSPVQEAAASAPAPAAPSPLVITLVLE
jgi:predicted anti-sigma-YlaC factor YlaD